MLLPWTLFSNRYSLFIGLQTCVWPARSQKISGPGITYYLDGAHTVESIQVNLWCLISKEPCLSLISLSKIFRCLNMGKTAVCADMLWNFLNCLSFFCCVYLFVSIFTVISIVWELLSESCIEYKPFLMPPPSWKAILNCYFTIILLLK